MEYFNYNGKMFRSDENVINVNSRGIRYGDGLFETMKSVDGELFLSDDHFNRLWNGMEVLKFKIPVHFSIAGFKAQISELLKKNKHNHTARIRLTVFRGEGALYDEISNVPGYVIQSWVLTENKCELNSDGLVLGIYNDTRKSQDILSNLKHNNFLPYVMAALYGKEQKWNDAVVLNTSGRICDTAIANIFLVKNEIIYTPSLDEGCIAGVMRKNVINQLGKNNVNVKEVKLTVEDLLNADEVFLTNSIYNMQWVRSIAEKRYTNSYIHKIYSMLFPATSDKYL